jgi:hypothetical protein
MDTTFASSTVARHLLRGALGLALLVGSVVWASASGPAALLLALPGFVLLRGCPTCWALGLAQTISRGRLEGGCQVPRS